MEAGQVIPVEYNGEQGEFYLSMYVDNQALSPQDVKFLLFQKAGEPNLYVDNDVIVGTLDYRSLRVAQRRWDMITIKWKIKKQLMRLRNHNLC